MLYKHLSKPGRAARNQQGYSITLDWRHVIETLDDACQSDATRIQTLADQGRRWVPVSRRQIAK